jgi:hypothetical protein
MDNPTCAAVSLRAESFMVGFHDGLVATFDRIGKVSWTRRLTTRVRAVARSLDGVWAAAASYPELLMLTDRGRPHYLSKLEESSLRADHTALAISPDGGLTVAGTRRGLLLGLDVQGNRVFTIGETEGDGKAEGAPARLGAIAAIAMSPKTGVSVAGGALGIVAVDPQGQDLWSTQDLNRITSIAASLGEEQTVVVGSRAGYAACLGGGGAVLWRAPTEGYVTSVCFRGTTQEALAASLDGALVCLDKNGKVLWSHRSPVGFAFVASSLDGEVIAAAPLTGKVVLLSAAGKVLAETEPLDGVIRAFALSAAGDAVLVGTSTNEVVLFKHKRPRAEVDEL